MNANFVKESSRQMVQTTRKTSDQAIACVWRANRE